MTGYYIKFTRKADNDEQEVYNYIKEEFGEIYAVKFREKFIATVQQLAKYPLIGRIAKRDKSLRVLILNEKNKIVYKVTEEEIIILRLLSMKKKNSGKY